MTSSPAREMVRRCSSHKTCFQLIRHSHGKVCVHEIHLLSQSDIIQLDLSRDDVLGAVEQAMPEHSADSYEMHPKIGVHPAGTDPDNFIHATPAYLKQLGACGLKWVGGFAKNPPHGLPIVTGIQVCNDVDTGISLAVMDCAYLTGLRTVSALP